MSKCGKHKMGKGGSCICPRCRTEIPHRRGNPCNNQHCPKCGNAVTMLRVGSDHYEGWLETPAAGV